MAAGVGGCRCTGRRISVDICGTCCSLLLLPRRGGSCRASAGSAGIAGAVAAGFAAFFFFLRVRVARSSDHRCHHEKSDPSLVHSYPFRFLTGNNC